LREKREISQIVVQIAQRKRKRFNRDEWDEGDEGDEGMPGIWHPTAPSPHRPILFFIGAICGFFPNWHMYGVFG